MKDEFKNSWAVILGGSQGLGFASARKLASHGMNICIVHRDRKSDVSKLENAFNDLRDLGVELKTFNMDLLKIETQKEVIAAIPQGSVSLLLHSIAKGSVKPLYAENDEALDQEDFLLTIRAMGTSWLEWTQAFIKAGLFAKDARNLAFTSEGNKKALKYYGAVSAAKATLESLMRQMALELAPLGIRSNCIQAGVTRTISFNRIPGSEQVAQFTEKRNPFHRLTRPEDVANAVYLLTKEEAAWINGAVIPVDGGESIR
ncbi:MAG: SDR family oxidoreductase [Bacteroidia bacterium]|nr:SDR family oxidoreductase [Bacteroidia bacterium]NNM22143.1 SDR family oxidoreductase [Flavobacteriaceae bacterium]